MTTDAPAWRMLFLLVQGTHGELVRALTLISFTALLLAAVLCTAAGLSQAGGPWAAAGASAAGSLVLAGTGAAIRRWVRSRWNTTAAGLARTASAEDPAPDKHTAPDDGG